MTYGGLRRHGCRDNWVWVCVCVCVCCMAIQDVYCHSEGKFTVIRKAQHLFLIRFENTDSFQKKKRGHLLKGKLLSGR